MLPSFPTDQWLHAPDFSQRRIAVFLPALVGGGAERVMLNLVQGLLAAGCQVDVVAAQAEGPLVNQIPNGARLVTLNPMQLPGLRTFAALPSLVHYLGRTRPDAIVTGLIRSNVVSIWARRLARVKTRTVITVHQLLSCEFHNFERWYLRVMTSLARRFYPHADAIVAVSNGTANELSRILGIKRDRIQVIYNPVLTPELKEKASAKLNHPWFVPGAPPVIVSAGRLEHPKDFATLIRAFVILKQRLNARLMILGEGPLRSSLEGQIAGLKLQDDVRMPGFLDNPYPFIAQASAFVLSSLSEALPTVLIEALYLGVPVLATDCPSGPREILSNGHYGRLVPPADDQSMAAALEETLTTKQVCRSSECWSPYTLKTATDQYLRVLLADPGTTWSEIPPLPTRSIELQPFHSEIIGSMIDTHEGANAHGH